MNYVGMDVHKLFCQTCVLDEQKEEIANDKVRTDRDSIERYVKNFDDDTKFAIEATIRSRFVYRILTAKGFEVKVADPKALAAITRSKKKTDLNDARILAKMLYLDEIPETYVPDERIMKIRDLTRNRKQLVERSTAIKNQIHATITEEGVWIPPKTDIFTNERKGWLRSLGMLSVDINLNCLDVTGENIKHYDKLIDEVFNETPEAQLLETIPGVGVLSAVSIIAEIGDASRFSSPDQLCAYSGLVPSVRQSGSSAHYGRITKQGPPQLRALMIECMHMHAQHDPDSRLSGFFQRKTNERGRKKAVVAGGRKMLRIIYYMLRDTERYHSQGS